MREIVLDTETTGLDPKLGHKIVEIGCVELINHIPTQNTYWQYINPDRDIPESAFAIHGLSQEFLSEKPCFIDIASDFLAFLDDAPLVIHNADFDMGFINSELKNIGQSPLASERVIDTLRIARQAYPGAPAKLNALCARFNIDNSNRDLHGALKDARLLAEVYLELIGGRQPDLALSGEKKGLEYLGAGPMRPIREARRFSASRDELDDHAALIEKLKNPIWKT